MLLSLTTLGSKHITIYENYFKMNSILNKLELVKSYLEASFYEYDHETIKHKDIPTKIEEKKIKN